MPKVELNSMYPWLHHNFGTSEGAKAAWDTRGRGQKEEEKKGGLMGRLFGKKEEPDDPSAHPIHDAKKSEKYYQSYYGKDVKPMTGEHAKKLSKEELDSHINQHSERVKEYDETAKHYDKQRHGELAEAFRKNLKTLLAEKENRVTPEERAAKAEEIRSYISQGKYYEGKPREKEHHSQVHTTKFIPHVF